MTFTSQFQAVRELHEAIHSGGESPALLGGLVRGYANLGLLTEYLWHPEHKAFKARALLYAQRMVARDEHSAQARWHRAYALALIGLHKAALDDLDAAEKEAKAAGGERPGAAGVGAAAAGVLPLRHRPAGRRGVGLLPGPVGRIAGLLLGRTGQQPRLAMAKATELLPWMPECYRLYHGQCMSGDLTIAASRGLRGAEGVRRKTLCAAGGHAGLARGRGRDRQAARRGKRTVGETFSASRSRTPSPEEEFDARAQLMAALLAAGKPAGKALPEKTHRRQKRRRQERREERGRRRRSRGPRRTVVVRLGAP